MRKPFEIGVLTIDQHGFALRCDLSKPYARWCMEQSGKGIAEYFDVQLGLFDERSKDGSKM